MIKSKKQSLIVISVFTLVLLLGSVTYAFFNYTRTGTQNIIKVGRIAFNSTQNGRINLTNVFPISASDLENDTGNHDEVIINITGDTTYSAGMEYLLSFSEVNNIVNGKKVPIKYNVTPTNLGDDATSYWTERGGSASLYHILDTDDIYDGKKVAVGYIKSGATGVNGSVKIEAYIDANDVAITDTPDENNEWQNGRTILTTSEWNSLAGTPLSFKIKVEANEGIWVRESPTPETCFTTNILSEEDHTVEIVDYNIDVEYTLNPNPTQEQISACANYMETNMGVPSEQLGEGESLEAFCTGTGTILGISLQTFLDAISQGAVPTGIGFSMLVELESTGILKRNSDFMCGYEVEIPKTINGYTVVKIADREYSGENTRTSFANKGIKKVNIPNTVTTIGTYAFMDNQLVSVVIPNSVTSIGDGAFENNQLTSVVLPNTIATIRRYTFENNQLTDIVIPNTVTSIEDSAFKHNKLPDEKAFIYKRTDTNHDGIAEIDSTTLIDYGGANKDVIIPNGVMAVGNNVFQNSDLTSVVIPDSVTSIGSYAFYRNKLTSVVIPNSVTTIGSYALFGNELTSVVIPNSVISIGSQSFNNNKLTDNQAFIYKRTDTNHDGIAEIDTTTIVGYGGANKAVVIPNGVITIGPYAFYGNELTSVLIPDGVKTIGERGFNSNQLTNVVIPGSITSIGLDSFGFNYNLSSITINQSCSNIKNNLKVGNNNYYPWLYYSSPYTKSGVTIYGANNEVCDAY